MLKSYLISIFSILSATFSFGQEYFNIADEGVHIIDCSTDSIIVTDGGDEFGYHRITFCLGVFEDENLEVLISPSMYGDIWDVNASSALVVYDGASTDSPQIGAGSFNSINAPNGILVRSTNPCITLAFASQNGPSWSGIYSTCTM